MTNQEYRQMLIEGILEFQKDNNFTWEVLDKKPIQILEEFMTPYKIREAIKPPSIYSVPSPADQVNFPTIPSTVSPCFF